MPNKELEILDVIGKIETLVYQFNNIEDYEKRILQAILNEAGYAELRDASVSLAECHVIDCIGRNEHVNTTAIAKHLQITKGGISKITAKLLKKNMIVTHRLDNNQKEIYYSLSPLGWKIFQLHEVLHKKAREKFTAILSGYNQAELAFASRFLRDLTATFQSAIAAKKK
jgi:DNA-binding MarR family transcriptional regulator